MDDDDRSVASKIRGAGALNISNPCVQISIVKFRFAMYDVGRSQGVVAIFGHGHEQLPVMKPEFFESKQCRMC